MSTMVRVAVAVHGVVQGVGFRPFVYTLANEIGLVGLVGNDSTKVFIEATGDQGSIEAFLHRLRVDAPPLARVDRIETAHLGPALDDLPTGFRIVESVEIDDDAAARTLVPPDTAICDDCRNELFDPGDRRFGHPFITCTNCGPRFTIMTGLPYDRPATTMAEFPLCSTCLAEYQDPGDRRYHAQPIACHRCGPRVTFRERLDEKTVDDPIDAAAQALGRGAIVAVKGLGGYHLACDAANNEAVRELRRRKHRADKPFAVMVADLDAAATVAEINHDEARLLTSGAAPIVLLRANESARLSSLVAPGNPLVGVMVAYSPLHLLLLRSFGRPLVMTSANRGGEPLAWTVEQLESIGDLFDVVLDHDRPIHQPCDDSVVRSLGSRILPIRRARGYAPIPVALPDSASPPTLAVGAELKNTFCVAAGGRAWVGQHIGDMENLATVQAFERGIDHYLDLYQVTPMVLAADAHPAYQSSNWARRQHRHGLGTDLVEVQHHHAHIASVMAEHRLPPDEPIIGFAFDGTGYGPGSGGSTEAEIWGGEALVASAEGYRRAGHLAPIDLPGGDAAIREPARIALAHLRAAGIPWSDDGPSERALDRSERSLLTQQLDRRAFVVPTTSMGRLFDAVASLLDLRHRISYEAQAAIELEVAASRGRELSSSSSSSLSRSAASLDDSYRFSVEFDERTGAWVADPAPVLRAIVAYRPPVCSANRSDRTVDRRSQATVDRIAWRFHSAVADLVQRWAAALRDETGIETVALSGGVFQNVLLAELCLAGLETAGFRALTHSLVPPNDGGLALGQALVASTQAAAIKVPNERMV